MTYVYFIAPVRGGCIKIGISGDPENRLHQLQCYGPPMEILATVPGRWCDERKIHAAFIAHWAGQSEWFWPSPEILALIDAIKASGKLPVEFLGSPDQRIPFPVRRSESDGRFRKRTTEERQKISAGIRATQARINAAANGQ